MTDDLEKISHERDLTANSAWVRLFDETIAAMRIRLDDKDLTVSDALNKLSDRDRSVREAAGKAIGAAFGDNLRLFSLITNTLAKDKEIEDTWRHYPQARQRAQSRQYGRGRGRRRAGHRRAAVLSAPVAPLLPDEGTLAGAAQTAALGSQRAAAKRR